MQPRSLATFKRSSHSLSPHLHSTPSITMLRSSRSANVIQSIFESLEERVLFDGVPDATFILPQTDSAEPAPQQVQSLDRSRISLIPSPTAFLKFE